MAISIRFPADIEMRLSRLAAKTGLSKAFFINEAIKAQLDDLEDRCLAEQRLAANRAGESKGYSLEQVEQELQKSAPAKS